jgi:hypothetical protein
MERFAVDIQPADAQTREALRAGGLTKAGGPPENASGDVISPEVRVVVEASGAQAAEQLVRAKLPPDIDYTIKVTRI